MEWRWRDRDGLRGAAGNLSTPGLLLAVICALALAGCNTLSDPLPSAAAPRGATVAFDSIDGLPPQQFHMLVQDLNAEAQARRLAVMPREDPSAYRVRGYLAAAVAKNHTTISWAWDVFDRERQRTLRISGAETVKGRHHNAWRLVDDAMLHRIADSSMGELAAFLTSPQVAPDTPGPAPQAVVASNDESSPEAAGIFRIFHPVADPVPAAKTSPASSAESDVPIPPARPTLGEIVSPGATVTVAAASHR